MNSSIDHALLEHRAAQLAAPLDARVATVHEVLEFTIDRDRYGLAMPEVAGIFRLGALGVLPGAADPLVGIASWRGTMLRVLDLRTLRGGRAAGLDDRSWVVAVGAGRPAYGLLVSQVTGPRALEEGVQEPAEGLAADRRFLLGTTRDGLQVLNSAAIHAAFAQGESR